MKQLLILLYLTGVLPPVLPITRKYFLIKQGKSWSDAQAYCRATYTDLATIGTPDEMAQIQSLVQSQSFTSPAWIGLYNDINSWHWSADNSSLGSLRNWRTGSGEPNNYYGVENCGLVWPTYWTDGVCTWACHFICFDGPPQDHHRADRQTGAARYIFYTKILSWLAAQSYCRQYHTDLASAKDATENSIIQGKIITQTWFGLIRDTWKWSDQSDRFSISWRPGQPDNYGGNENCAVLLSSLTNDLPCSQSQYFFCHALTRKEQILQVKLQSDQVVNDPAVSAMILEKIQQKLMEQGITAEITIKWRQQQGGVFSKIITKWHL